MKYLLLALFLTACSPTTVRVIDDVIEGEAKVIESIVNDEMGQPAGCMQPSAKPVVVPIQKF